LVWNPELDRPQYPLPLIAFSLPAYTFMLLSDIEIDGRTPDTGYPAHDFEQAPGPLATPGKRPA
jgi:hypothetical protein